MAKGYKRILLKLSGEAMAGDQKTGINGETVSIISKSIKDASELGVEMAIVVGGGNFWRGRSSEHMDRACADYIGMLATAMNALALSDALRAIGVDNRVQTAITMQQIAEPYIRGRAIRHMEKGRVVIFGCGTGSPFFSTDTASALRAAEIEADIIFKATMVDGIYDSDPNKNSNAKKFDKITYSEILSRNLKLMDPTATAMCMENNIPILVFSLDDPHNIVRAVQGENIGTIVREEL